MNFGQRLAHDQMVEIHAWVHRLLMDVLTDSPYCEACDEDPVEPPPDIGSTASGTKQPRQGDRR